MQDVDMQSADSGREPLPMGEEGVTQQASPEEQEQYDLLRAQMMKVVYNDKALPKVLKMLQGEGDPMEGLARSAAMVVARVATSAEKNGIKLNGEVLMAAGKETVEDLADLATKAGIHDFEKDTEALEGAYFRALDQFRLLMTEAGRLDQGKQQEEFNKLQKMSESGELDQLLNSLANEEKIPQEGDDQGGLGQALGVEQ